MQTSQLYRELTDVFRDVFDNDQIVLTPDTTAVDIDGWDSVAHVATASSSYSISG